jgi:hypothetical protein
MNEIKDITLAPSGHAKINWVKDYMPTLSAIEKDFIKTKPFAGMKISMSIHLEAKTAYLATVLKNGGADVYATGCNPLSTQDDVAAALSEYGVHVYAVHGDDEENYTSRLRKALSCKPDLMIDDGGDFTQLIHGEYRHLYANKDIAEFMGIPSENIFISELGKVLEIDKKGARFNGCETAGKVLVDGSGVGDIGSVVLRDRKHLSEDGLVVVVATIDLDDQLIVSGPDIVSRGFVYVKESEELMKEARRIAVESLERAMARRMDWAYIKGEIRDDLAKFIFK